MPKAIPKSYPNGRSETVVLRMCGLRSQMNERDPDSGQFLSGHTGIGRRPKGSRNKLGEAFIADL
jgi:hypothetical protein